MWIKIQTDFYCLITFPLASSFEWFCVLLNQNQSTSKTWDWSECWVDDKEPTRTFRSVSLAATWLQPQTAWYSSLDGAPDDGRVVRPKHVQQVKNSEIKTICNNLCILLVLLHICNTMHGTNNVKLNATSNGMSKFDSLYDVYINIKLLRNPVRL